MSGLQARLRIQRDAERGEFSLDAELEIPDRGVTAILGRSGSGKTTLLRCLAGLEPDLEGRIQWGDEVWWDSGLGIRLPCHRRRIAFVFEEGRLFPHLDVAGNLAARGRNRPPCDAAYRDRVIELLQISGLMQRAVPLLSAGERQRVAIGRALLSGARLVLMDEPLSALDHRTREPVLQCLEHLHQELRVPIVYVSHTLSEVARLADRLVVLEAGRILEQGSAVELFADPESYVSRGDDPGMFLSCSVVEQDAGLGLTRLAVNGLASDEGLWVAALQEKPRQEIRLRIRAGDVSLTRSRTTDSSILNQLPASVIAVEECGEVAVLVRLQVGEQALLARITRRSLSQLGIRAGMAVFAQVKSVSISGQTIVR